MSSLVKFQRCWCGLVVDQYDFGVISQKSCWWSSERNCTTSKIATTPDVVSTFFYQRDSRWCVTIGEISTAPSKNAQTGWCSNSTTGVILVHLMQRVQFFSSDDKTYTTSLVKFQSACCAFSQKAHRQGGARCHATHKISGVCYTTSTIFVENASVSNENIYSSLQHVLFYNEVILILSTCYYFVLAPPPIFY